MPRIVTISDTHGYHDRLRIPDGDVLIHAGDFTRVGRDAEIAAFDAWLGGLPHRYKVVIAGNHDASFQERPAAARKLLTNAVYLQDSETTVAGLRVYGSPWQPWFMDWAFNLERGPALAEKWALIPEGIDVLVTHGPPAEILDLTRGDEHAGCEDLRARVLALEPKLHIFGHIHEAAGERRLGPTLFVNASCYGPWGRPVVVDLY